MKAFFAFALAAMLLCFVSCDGYTVPHSPAKAQIAVFRIALAAYREDVGRYPSTAQGLHALRVNPGEPGWKGPYMPQDIPPDPRGRPYRYTYPGSHGMEPDIVSDGPVESWKFR